MAQRWIGKGRGKTVTKTRLQKVARDWNTRPRPVRPLRPAHEVEGNDYARRAANDDTYRDD